jgi:hypothetical protein
MSVVHIVLFQVKADAKPEDIKAACDRILSLKDNCIHPTTKAPYILSLKCGKDNSPEGLQVRRNACCIKKHAYLLLPVFVD